jgi:hypothetical protein
MALSCVFLSVASIYIGSDVKIAGKALGWHIAVNWRRHAGKDDAA